MVDILGTTINTPSIDISGFISSSWIYILIIGFVGFILILGIAVILFITTYNRKIILFENVSGLGYQPVLRTRARIIKVGTSGVEVLKTLKGGEVISAYGRKMGKNSYWFGKAQDGYWYNIVLGDLDAKLGMLDIEPVDRDVRMFHVALDRLSEQKHGRKAGFMEKYGLHMLTFLFLIIMIVGMYILIGRINEGIIASVATGETNVRVAELLANILQGADNIQNLASSTTGLVPAG